jgi:hypothetical protein
MIIKYLVIRLLPILFLVALGYSFFIPSAGERQFTRMEEALGRANSYRMDETAQGKDFIEHWRLEVACPDHEHSRQTSEPANPQWDSPKGMDIEEIDAGNRSYSKFGESDWKINPFPAKTHCRKTPFLQQGSLPDFKHIRALAKIEKKDVDTVAGQACREWIVTFHAPNGNEKILDYCIGDDDLPRRLKTNENSFQVVWTDWNQAIDIEPPELSR